MAKKIIIRRKIPASSRETLLMQTTQTTTETKTYDLEDLFSETLNILFEGMTHGNQIDKKSAEALIKSIKYKTSEEFYNNCINAYDEALKIHESVFSEGIVNKITRNITEMMETGKEVIKKITQKIILNSPKNES